MFKIGYKNCADADGLPFRPTNGKVKILRRYHHKEKKINQTQTGLFPFNTCKKFPNNEDNGQVFLTVQGYTKSLEYDPSSVIKEELETKLCQKCNMTNFHDFIYGEMPLKNCLSRGNVVWRPNFRIMLMAFLMVTNLFNFYLEVMHCKYLKDSSS